MLIGPLCQVVKVVEEGAVEAVQIVPVIDVECRVDAAGAHHHLVDVLSVNNYIRDFLHILI
jgi:hypothetical protein